MGVCRGAGPVRAPTYTGPSLAVGRISVEPSMIKKSLRNPTLQLLDFRRRFLC